MPIVTVVLGLKRGGTSLVAGIVHALGIPMGERFSPPEIWNEKGFFEDMDFVDATAGILDADLQMGRVKNSRRPEALEGMSKFIRSRNAKYDQWGLKNFALNYMLPEFVERCQSCAVQVVRVTRSFGAAVDSQLKKLAYEGKTLGDCVSEQAHLLYNTDKAYQTHPGRKFTVDYDELVVRPWLTVDNLAAWLGASLYAVPEAARLVDPKLRHFA